MTTRDFGVAVLSENTNISVAFFSVEQIGEVSKKVELQVSNKVNDILFRTEHNRQS